MLGPPGGVGVCYRILAAVLTDPTRDSLEWKKKKTIPCDCEGKSGKRLLAEEGSRENAVQGCAPRETGEVLSGEEKGGGGEGSNPWAATVASFKLQIRTALIESSWWGPAAGPSERRADQSDSANGTYLLTNTGPITGKAISVNVGNTSVSGRLRDQGESRRKGGENGTEEM